AFLDVRADGESRWVAGRLEDAGDGCVRFRARGDPQPRPQRPGRLAGAPVVATFVPAETGLGRCFCPVLDLGRHAMRIESALPFPRGTVLRDVLLTHKTALLRHADGTVLSLGEIVHPDGHSSWECAVRLRRRSEPLPAADPADTTG